MNKRLLFGIVIAFIIVFIVGGIYMDFFRKTESKATDTIGTYKLTEYSFFLENFPSEKVLGSINSAQRAKENAESVWLELYGESVKSEKSYQVFFDDSSNTWLVTGSIRRSLFSNIKGGVAQIIVRMSDGKVLAVWHEK